MPKKTYDKIELIAKFLDPNINLEAIEDINDIIKLPASTFKFLEESDVLLIKELFNITKIGQFSILDQDHPFDFLIKKSEKKRREIEQVLQIDRSIDEKIKKAITLSLIIQRIREEILPLVKKEQKIIVVGLNNAGKTTILSKFGGRIGIKELARLKPTKGIDRQEIFTRNMALSIWDFGGQKDFRDKYLRKPERYFLDVDLIIYVIDIQAHDKFDESINYFEKIINTVVRLEKKPYVLIFIHKYDPDLRDDTEILLNIELIKDLIKSVFIDKNLDYDIYLSSIYSMIANEPKFSKFIKRIMQEEATLENPTMRKIEGLSRIIENTLNAVIQ